MAERTVTRWLAAWSEGSAEAKERVAPLVYGELRRLAARYLWREPSAHTLETDALVHEAFLRLVDDPPVRFEDRSHFFGIVARLMRRVLVDHGRGRRSARRGGGARPLPLDAARAVGETPAAEGLVLRQALGRLAAAHPEAGRVVELRFFAGLTEDEIAAELAVSVPTVRRRWRLARAWLHRYLSPAGPPAAA